MPPPPNSPAEGLTTPTSHLVNVSPFQAPSSHRPSAMANASEGESTLPEIDYQGIEYTEPVDDTLLCPVCKTPFYSPITTSCGHTFCAVCLNRALETQTTCPIDRQPINKNQDYYRLPLIVKDQLDRLRVKCPNKGCDHECSREHLEGHCERRCEFTLVRCPEPTCTKLVARRDATAEKGCLHGDTACEFCNKTMSFAELDAHFGEDCDGVTVECPDCQSEVARHRMGRHQAEDCPEKQIQCKWQAAGCKVADKRRVVQEHQESGCPLEVVGHLLELRAEDRRTIEELSSRLASLEASNDRRRRHRERRDRRNDIPEGTPETALAPSSASDNAAALDSPEEYMLSQFERLDMQMDQLQKNTHDMEARLALSFLQHTTRVGEQFAELASKVGVINMHTAWLMNMQRQSHAQQRAGLAAGGPAGQAAEASHSGDAGAGPRSSSSDGGGGVRYQTGSRRNSDGSRENRTRL